MPEPIQLPENAASRNSIASASVIDGRDVQIRQLQRRCILLERRIRELGGMFDCPSIAEIKHTVCEWFCCSAIDLVTYRLPRTGGVFPRHVALYLARHLTKCHLTTLARVFDYADHGAVMRAVRAVERRMANDAELRETVAALTAKLTASGQSRRAV
jgi:chromosomal replication initiation ATPase DnaA